MGPPFATRDVSSKSLTLRSAKASASLIVAASTIDAIRRGATPKADPIGVAKVAGIQAAKQTSLLVPHCHQVPLDFIQVDVSLDDRAIMITSEVKAIWKTGVEMEALVAASAAALTLYDMLKGVDEDMEIRSVRLLEKKGGKSAIRDSGEGLSSAVVVLSNSVSRGKRTDSSGLVLMERLKKLHFSDPLYRVLPDDRPTIEKELKSLADVEKCDLILTTGGTGTGPEDLTPEATLAVIDRRLEGVEETLRSFGQSRIPTAMLSRNVVGLRGSTLIINFPGSPSGAADGMDALFPAILHTFKMIRGGAH